MLGLEGISLVAVADDLSAKMKERGVEGTFFILLSKKIPDLGLLIKAPDGFSIEDVKSQASGEIAVSGKVMSVKDDGLVEFAKQSYEMRLTTGESGDVLWVENTADLPWEKKKPDGEK